MIFCILSVPTYVCFCCHTCFPIIYKFNHYLCELLVVTYVCIAIKKITNRLSFENDCANAISSLAIVKSHKKECIAHSICM